MKRKVITDDDRNKKKKISFYKYHTFSFSISTTQAKVIEYFTTNRKKIVRHVDNY